MSHRRKLLLDCALIFVLAGLLIKPLFKTKYLDKWSSIESTFIADARFLAETWPGPRWQPLWYCGTRFDYIYPPALRYGTAGLTKIFPILPVRAYHIYCAVFFAFGIVAVYLLVRTGSGSRGAAWLAAAATALLSPSFLFLKHMRDDAPFWTPQRLGVLIRYGEGPHMTALAWLPLALAFCWRYFKHGRPLDLVLATLGCTMVLHNNFYGATALSILFPIAAWSLYIVHRQRRIWLRAALVAVLSYGVAAVWFVPSYVLITFANMKYVSQGGNAWSAWVTLAVFVAYVVLSDHWVRGREQRAYPAFLAGAAGFFSLNVLGEHFFGFRVIGEPSRLAPELDLVLILLVTEVLRYLWTRGRPVPKLAIALLVLASFAPACRFVMKSWSLFVPDLGYKDRVEYQLQDWMAKNMPDSRAVAGGSVRFWYNAWNNLAQVGGGSEQGMLSGETIMGPQWQIYIGENGELAKYWLQVLGADAIIVNGKTSTEHFHDFVHPEKFAGVLPVLHDNGKGDIIYRVPRKYPGLARVVDRAALDSLRPVAGDWHIEGVRAHAALVEEGPDVPARMVWDGFDAFRVQTSTTAGQSLLVQVVHGSPWRAWDRGVPVPIRKDNLGFMRLDLPPGDHDLRFEFTLPLENLLGRMATVSTLAILAGLIVWSRKRPEARI